MLVYSCSGASNVAQLANYLAVRLDRLGLAEMSCIVGVGGGVGSLVRKAQSGERIIAIDGCPLGCTERVLAARGLDPVATLELGALYETSTARLSRLMAGVPTRPHRTPMDVNAGRGFVFVSHRGSVHPSGFLPIDAGNVREVLLEAGGRNPRMAEIEGNARRLGIDVRRVAQQALARRYADLFQVYVKHAADMDRVTFWGVDDADSWLNNWPVRGRTSYPLLFDRNGAPKPAFDAVIATAR